MTLEVEPQLLSPIQLRETEPQLPGRRCPRRARREGLWGRSGCSFRGDLGPGSFPSLWGPGFLAAEMSRLNREPGLGIPVLGVSPRPRGRGAETLEASRWAGHGNPAPGLWGPQPSSGGPGRWGPQPSSGARHCCLASLGCSRQGSIRLAAGKGSWEDAPSVLSPQCSESQLTRHAAGRARPGRGPGG